jgi:hypothetical protein
MVFGAQVLGPVFREEFELTPRNSDCGVQR